MRPGVRMSRWRRTAPRALAQAERRFITAREEQITDLTTPQSLLPCDAEYHANLEIDLSPRRCKRIPLTTARITDDRIAGPQCVIIDGNLRRADSSEWANMSTADLLWSFIISRR